MVLIEENRKQDELAFADLELQDALDRVIANRESCDDID
jgi:hypothetical protein